MFANQHHTVDCVPWYQWMFDTDFSMYSMYSTKNPNVHQPNLTCGDIAQDPHLGMVPEEIEMVILKHQKWEWNQRKL
jgi:hypothetical protein